MRQLTRSIGDTIFENLGRAAGRFQENRPLPADVLESDDAYLVVFDAPGVTATDVQVRYVEDRVEVRIDRFRDFHDGFEMVYPGRGLSLAGSATLPEGATVDTESATATLRDDGTLRVRIPKGWGEPGSAGEDLGDEIDDTVEEADEREDAGTEVGDETDGGSADSERQDETDAEATDGSDDGDDEAWDRQDETDAEGDESTTENGDATDDESADAASDEDVTKEDKDHDDPGP